MCGGWPWSCFNEAREIRLATVQPWRVFDIDGKESSFWRVSGENHLLESATTRSNKNVILVINPEQEGFISFLNFVGLLTFETSPVRVQIKLHSHGVFFWFSCRLFDMLLKAHKSAKFGHVWTLVLECFPTASFRKCQKYCWHPSYLKSKNILSLENHPEESLTYSNSWSISSSLLMSSLLLEPFLPWERRINGRWLFIYLKTWKVKRSCRTMWPMVQPWMHVRNLTWLNHIESFDDFP